MDDINEKRFGYKLIGKKNLYGTYLMRSGNYYKEIKLTNRRL